MFQQKKGKNIYTKYVKKWGNNNNSLIWIFFFFFGGGGGGTSGTFFSDFKIFSKNYHNYHNT